MLHLCTVVCVISGRYLHWALWPIAHGCALHSCLLAMQGEMKLQIDRMIAKFFSSLPVDEQLNFSVAVTVMSVQRKWRQRMKAHKVDRLILTVTRRVVTICLCW